MKPDEEQCLKFPSVLRDKLLKGELVFPEKTEFEYEKIYVYRAVERKKDDFHEIDKEDFRSYFELKKKPKHPRTSVKNDPHFYGVSSFLDKEIVKLLMKFPNPNKKMAAGYVYKEGGPQETNKETRHVCWWLYDKIDVYGFELLKEDSNG